MSLAPSEYDKGYNAGFADAAPTSQAPDDIVVSEIAAKCVELRKAAGLSLDEAGRRAGFTKSHMWDFEQGRARNPTIRMLLGLARAYGVSLDYLIGGSTTLPPLDREALRIAGEIDTALRKARAST